MAEQDQNSGPQHLSNLKAVEVSFVPRGANRKTFLVLKEDDTLKLQDLIAKTELKNRVQVLKILKDGGLDDDSADSVSAILRALSALGTAPELLQKAAEMAGVQMAAPPAAAPPAAAPPAAPPAAGHQPPPPPGHAPPPAAGHQPPPHAPAPVAQMGAPAAPPPAAPGAPQAKDAYGIMKADGTLDLDNPGVPEHIRPVLKTLWEGNQKTAAIMKQLDDERDARITKEYVEQAATFTHLPGTKAAELGPVLKEIATKAPDAFAKVQTILKAASDLISKSDALTREIGSGGVPPATGAKVSYEMIEQAAMAHPIAKAEGMSKEKATTAFITKTAEGRKMYSEYRIHGAEQTK